MHFQQNAMNYHNIITTKMHFITFNFKWQLNFTNNFNATVDFATVWPTLKFMAECLTVLTAYHPRVFFNFVPLFWCELEVKNHSHQFRYENNLCPVHQNQLKWRFMKNIMCWWIILQITELVLLFIKNIGYTWRGREWILCKCIFFLLEVREVSVELNFKRLKVVCYRCVLNLIMFFSFFNNTWQFLKRSNASLHYFMMPVLQLQIKCLQICREAGWCLYTSL